MGYTLHRLEVIKERFVNSNLKDRQNLFTFIEEQLAFTNNNQDQESKFTVFLDRQLVDRLRGDITHITSIDLETILDFADERLEVCRSSDRADRITGSLDRDTFIFREERYTEIENFILALLIGYKNG